jgi:L-threonylcarbamoyladenylate synthase
MLTEYIDIKEDFVSAIEKAVEFLIDGNIIAFPTETVYGIGVLLEDQNAIKSVFEVKGRRFDNPLSAYISKLDEVRIYVSIYLMNSIYWQINFFQAHYQLF